MVKKAEEKMNGNYHVVITDNKTGDILYDENTNAILGGVSTDDGSCEIVCVKGNIIDIASATMAAKQSVDDSIKKHPEIALLTSLLEAEIKCEKEVK